jgi:hypothetical protein
MPWISLISERRIQIRKTEYKKWKMRKNKQSQENGVDFWLNLWYSYQAVSRERLKQSGWKHWKSRKT